MTARRAARASGPLVCYALAADKQSAQQCAWDVSFAPDNPEDAEPYPSPPFTLAKPRLYRVTITAVPVRAPKKGKPR